MSSPTTATFAINGRKIGPGQPVYVIAELSANHGQRYEAAVELVRGAPRRRRRRGQAADLHRRTRSRSTATRRRSGSGDGSLWEGTTLHDLYRDGVHAVGVAAQAEGRSPTSSGWTASRRRSTRPRSTSSRRWTSRRFKIASFELVDLPLIRHGRRDRQADDHVDRDGDRRTRSTRPSRPRATAAPPRSRCSSARAPTRRRPRR